jgi:hypothetical protein
MAGGFCYQKKWRMDSENLTDKDHIRGALKATEKKLSTNRWLKPANGLGYR